MHRPLGHMACGLLALVLSACGGSAGSPTACNAPAAGSALLGTVTAVHDGDTLTLSTGNSVEHVRLQGIDAPELAQDFGEQARQALTERTLQQPVRVVYTQRDRYDRVLGQVFTADCTDVNQRLLELGMAWFYKAYACDLEASRRLRYASAETQASSHRLGLWSQNQPTAPWVFRNGEDTPAPQCPG